MATLSNGNHILSGEYTKDMKIKKCSHCDCYSPVQADTCCWCGSENLTIIDGAKEVKREQTELAETIKSNSKRNGIMTLVGLIFCGLGLLLMFSDTSFSDTSLIGIGVMLTLFGGVIPLLLAGTKALNNKVIIKYGNIDNFLNGISEQLRNQENFTSDNNAVPKYVEMRKSLNNDFNTQISKQDFIKLLDIWFEGYISPEVIRIRINKYLKENKYKHDKEIASITNVFYDERQKAINSIEQRTNNILDNQNNRISNIQTTGLNYGIITNSVTTATLYNVMNNKEHHNQFNRQLSPILTSTNIHLNSTNNSLMKRDEQIYINYKARIKRCLKQKFTADT